MSKPQPSPTSRRNWIPCGCVLGMFLVCVVIPVAALLVWSNRAARQVNAQLALIRQSGLPTASREMNEFYRLRPGQQDATQLYLDAQQVFSGGGFETACHDLPIVGDAELEIPPPGQPWAEQEAVEALLSDYAGGLRALHQAAAIGGAARFPLAFEDGFGMLLPQTQEMRTSARMLALEAHVKAHQGDAEGAARAILDLVAISRSLENQPILVSQLVRVAIHGIAVDLTAQLLSCVEFSDDDLGRLQRVFRQDDFKAGISHGLAGERVLGTEAFGNPAQALGQQISTPASRLVRGRKEDLALYLKIQTDLRAAVELDYPETFAAVDQAFNELQRKIDTPLGRFRYVMTNMTLPSVEPCVTAAARADGSSRCIDAAIAVERFRRREGRLPDALEDLVPDFLSQVPVDPFDGSEIRYIARSDAYLIYTCGGNRVDDGGIDDDARTDDVIRIELKPTAMSPEPGSTGPRSETSKPAKDAP